MSNVVGYARVSTSDQELDLQTDALNKAGAVKIFCDHASGATASRPELDACLEYLRPGDVLAVWRIDRLGRSVKHLVELVQQLDERDIQFRSLTEAIDTTTPGGELVFHIFAAVAQMERRLISERTKAGLASAKARGRNGGRPSVMTSKKLGIAREMRDRGETLQTIASTLQVGRTTISDHLAAQHSS